MPRPRLEFALCLKRPTGLESQAVPATTLFLWYDPSVAALCPEVSP